MWIYDALRSRVSEQFISLIEKEKGNFDKPLRKICDQCITYLKLEKVRQDDTEKSIDMVLKQQSSKDNPINLLLLATLYVDIDEEDTAFEYYEKFSETELAKPIKEEVLDYIIFYKFFQLGEHSLLMPAGLKILEKYSNNDNVNHILLDLYHSADQAPDFNDACQTFINKARELFPDNYIIENFQGFLHAGKNDYESAIVSYKLLISGLEKDTEKPGYNLNMAQAYDTIADCYMKTGNWEMVIDAINSGLSYDKNTEDYSIENTLLNKRALGYLRLKEPKLATEDINKILSEEPNNNEANETLHEIKNSFPDLN